MSTSSNEIARSDECSTEEELQRRLAEAEDQLSRKDRLLSTVLHELRTPLATLMLWEEILRTQGSDERMRARALDAVRQSARAQLRLVDGLLDLVRAMAGRLRIERRPVAVNQAAAAALASARIGVEWRCIAVEMSLDPAAGEVLGDPLRIEQALGDILNRAIRTTDKGGRIHIRTARVGAEVEISVTDTGQGIPPDLLPYVFEPIAAPGATLRGIDGGLGLDLALVRPILDELGGRGRAACEELGAGATVTIVLPAA